MHLEALRALPKVILHDHLDGGLRVASVVELADESGYTGLPTRNETDLASWFFQGGSGSLEAYLAAFEHTLAVLQRPEALRRAAYEAVIDLHAHNVVYAEIRFAPSLNTGAGGRREDAVEAVLDGLAAGTRDTGVATFAIVTAMRQMTDSAAVAAVAARFVDRGVVGFDLAGPERGYPPSDHLDACILARRAGLRLSIHAGEAGDLDSIAAAVDPCGAERLGHGVRMVDDMVRQNGEIMAVGSLATQVRDRGIVLEVCPTSNLHTQAFKTAADHPLGTLHRAGFAVTINTDNRLMSHTDPTLEFSFAVEHQGLSVTDLEQMTLTAIDAAFCDETTRAAVRERVVAGYAGAS